MPQNLYKISLLLFFIEFCNGFERELTVNIDPRKEDCFFQPVKAGDVIDVEYQVIDGGHGDLDISFRLLDPNGRIWITDVKKSENNHRFNAKIPGDYRLCFDNTFSAFNTKTVFFEMIIENENGNGSDWEDSRDVYPGLKPEEVYDIKVEDILDTINNVRIQLGRVRATQEILKSSEARDRNISEENFWKVNTFSVIQIIIMLMVGCIQVIMVRSLFDETSRVHKMWKNINK